MFTTTVKVPQNLLRYKFHLTTSISPGPNSHVRGVSHLPDPWNVSNFKIIQHYATDCETMPSSVATSYQTDSLTGAHSELFLGEAVPEAVHDFTFDFKNCYKNHVVSIT
jgi:hypothetical protein